MITKDIGLSRVERITYTVSETDVMEAVQRYLPTRVSVPTGGRWAFDWCDDDDGTLEVVAVQSFEAAIEPQETDQ